MELSNKATKQNPVDFLLQFPVADGYALYIVNRTRPEIELIFVPSGDAWQIPEAHLRGLRISDITNQMKMRDLFN